MKYGAITTDKLKKLKKCQNIHNLVGGSRTPKNARQYIEQIEQR